MEDVWQLLDYRRWVQYIRPLPAAAVVLGVLASILAAAPGSSAQEPTAASLDAPACYVYYADGDSPTYLTPAMCADPATQTNGYVMLDCNYFFHLSNPAAPMAPCPRSATSLRGNHPEPKGPETQLSNEPCQEVDPREASSASNILAASV
ncbi:MULTISPECIES: hypothetical protein [unclassified Nocardia]|uniref:hypothetical protein n=1 Tax=unclassified Nocardia TaxID=2637762 RepID=UPI001CE3C8AF|nr:MULTISPECIES: hypothetical protein [unclassified Nocardia]